MSRLVPRGVSSPGQAVVPDAIKVSVVFGLSSGTKGLYLEIFREDEYEQRTLIGRPLILLPEIAGHIVGGITCAMTSLGSDDWDIFEHALKGCEPKDGKKKQT